MPSEYYPETFGGEMSVSLQRDGNGKVLHDLVLHRTM
jgi:hypothetical protein